MTAMKMKSTAAPPIEMPAMAPVLRVDDEAGTGVAEAEELGVAVAAGGNVYEADVGPPAADEATLVGELDWIPFAVRLTYAAQSETGTASGQVLAWHRDNN